MSLLDRYLFPRINDFALGAPMDSFRAEVAGGAQGRVLEIGAGTGLNARHYPSGTEVVALEPSEGMRLRAAARLREPDVRASVQLVEGRVEALPFGDESFDTVVLTFVLCSVQDLNAALAEVRRVLRRGGSLRLVEHVKSPDPSMARWQVRIRPIWTTLLGGCEPARDVAAALERAELETRGLASIELPLPPIVRAGLIGAAIRP